MEPPTSYFLLPALFSPAALDLLVTETNRLYPQAEKQLVTSPSPKERGGQPARKYRSVGGGEIQTGFYNSAALLKKLETATQLELAPTGMRGTYSYYEEENDFLDIHRDIYTCDMTLITCIQSNISENNPSGSLYIYPGRTRDPIRSLYNDRFTGYYTVFLKPGDSVLIKGGILPHGVNPLARGSYRVISALCYRFKEPGPAPR